MMPDFSDAEEIDAVLEDDGGEGDDEENPEDFGEDED
jgi:hypothetical protein